MLRKSRDHARTGAARIAGWASRRAAQLFERGARRWFAGVSTEFSVVQPHEQIAKQSPVGYESIGCMNGVHGERVGVRVSAVADGGIDGTILVGQYEHVFQTALEHVDNLFNLKQTR